MKVVRPSSLNYMAKQRSRSFDIGQAVLVQTHWYKNEKLVLCPRLVVILPSTDGSNKTLHGPIFTTLAMVAKTVVFGCMLLQNLKTTKIMIQPL